MFIEADRHALIEPLPLDREFIRRYAAEVTQEAVVAIEKGPPPEGLLANYEGPERLAYLYSSSREPRSWALGVYSGLLGALWGVHYLERHDIVDSGIDYAILGKRLHDSFLAMPERESNACMFFGEIGYLAFRYLVERDQALADRAFYLAEYGYRNDVDDVFWGAPAFAMVCLRFLELQPEQVRWASLFRDIVAYLWSRRVVDAQSGASLWCQHLDGVHVKHLGAAHGFAGVASALLQGAHLLPDALCREIVEVTRDTLQRTALRTCLHVNWPQSVGGARPGRTAMLMQWCHGAPGILTSVYQASVYPTDELLEDVANSVWAAGPLVKDRGGLCHGTAGNGYAFLTSYQRVAGPWLERARAFAAHAIERSRHARAERGGYKIALWTGDIGTAVFALDCLLESPGFLALDKL
jgi:hypothetical protein